MRQVKPGVEVDGYLLEEKLHQGGMATIWRVSHAGMTAPLVMKIPRLKSVDDPTAIVGFEVEQMIMKKLSGPHVPKFYAASDLTDQPYIVMERIDGQPLSQRLDSLPLDIDEVADIGRRIATGLHQLHRQHVIHLDVKPSNIMFRPGGEAVFVDFGLSRHDQLPDLLAEDFRLPLGTGPYISPEQVLHVRNDPRSDLFAVGALLYFLLTGKRPFGFPTTVAGLRKRLYSDPAPPISLRPDCPPWLQEIILRCLAAEPAQRYGSAAELAMQLQHPEQVVLTERAAKRKTDGLGTVARRWLKSLGTEALSSQSAEQQTSRALMLMVAVDLTHGEDALSDKLRFMSNRILQIEPEARVACVSVLKTHRIALDLNEDSEGRNAHLQKLIALKHWSRGLSAQGERVTHHVLAHYDPASALLEHAEHCQVDHLLLGARGSSRLRRHLGSVSAEVVARATCSVTVVRADVPSQQRTDQPASGDKRRGDELPECP